MNETTTACLSSLATLDQQKHAEGRESHASRVSKTRSGVTICGSVSREQSMASTAGGKRASLAASRRPSRSHDAMSVLHRCRRQRWFSQIAAGYRANERMAVSEVDFIHDACHRIEPQPQCFASQ
jgi:hypothetical protein